MYRVTFTHIPTGGSFDVLVNDQQVSAATHGASIAPDNIERVAGLIARNMAIHQQSKPRDYTYKVAV